MKPWIHRLLRMLYALPIYCVTRVAFDWKKLTHSAHPWSDVFLGIVIQGLFFTLFFSLFATATSPKTTPESK